MASIQTVTDPEELRHAADIIRRLDQWQLLKDEFDTERAKPLAPMSELFRDDQQTAWMQLSHIVETCLAMAHDNLRALDEMLRPQGELRVPMYAHYPVLRSILEASAEAKWILLPDDRMERITRALQSRVSDLKFDAELQAEIRSTLLQMDDPLGPEAIGEYDTTRKLRHAKHMLKIKEIAAEQGIPWSSLKEGKPGTARLIRSVSGHPGAPGGYVTQLWKIMSGLSHPSVSRSVNHSTIEERGESRGGVVEARVTADLSWTSQAITAVVGTTLDSVRLFSARRQTPFVFPARITRSTDINVGR